MSRTTHDKAERIQPATAGKPVATAASEVAPPSAGKPSIAMNAGWRWLVFFWMTSFAFLLLYDVLRAIVQLFGHL